MPGVPVPGPEGRQESSAAEPACQALQGARQELESCRHTLEQRVEEALHVVHPLVSTISGLREEAAALRAEQQRLRQNMERLRRFLNQEKDPSTLRQASEDPCAHSESTEVPKEPVAHPPTFASTRKPSEAHPSHGSPAPGSSKQF